MSERADTANETDWGAVQERRSSVDWLGAAALRLHATMIAGVALSAGAAWFEWTRALRGHEVAWVYAFEWPLFAVMGIYVWWKLLHGDRPVRRPGAASSASRRATAAVPGSDDPGLAAWQDYLSRLHAADPPGRPPTR
jgi:hypothetical protein